MTPAAVSVTFDNLGEASDARARLSGRRTSRSGTHFSVTRALPRVLDALDEAGLRATFFVEGLNAELYPDTLRGLDGAGHEVACHGWRHERWSDARAPPPSATRCGAACGACARWACARSASAPRAAR